MIDDSIEYRRTHMDTWVLFCTIALVVTGIIMNYSASAVLSQEKYGDGYYYLKRTIIFTCIGFAGMVFATKLSYGKYKRLVYLILATAFFLVCLVFVPHIGKTIGGGTRWISIGPITFQPSEAAKLAMIIFLAYSLEKKSKKIKTFVVGFMPHLVFMSIVAMFILYQKDFGSAVIIASITWAMMFVAGVQLKYLIGMLAGVIPLGIMLITGSEYRMKRILAFINPWSDRYGYGFQMIQSFVAFNEGGWFGKGLGQGQQKLFYLPEAHTDFILSVIGEELGYIGVTFILTMFCVIAYRGLHIALDAPDLFGRYLAVGCTLLISIQAILNMGVVMGLLPTKGLTLPFVSYGGSSLVMSLISIGILLNISTYKKIEASWRHAL